VLTARLVCVAGDENGACSSSAAQDINCARILPEINDMPAQEEPHNSLSADSCSVLHDVSASCSVGSRPVCHKQDLNCHTDAVTDTAVNGHSGNTVLPSLCDAYVGSVTGANIHATDSSPREKLLPLLCGANPTKESCDSLANACVADSHAQEKLLPSLTAAV